MATVLVTGFGPFLKVKVNASWEAVKLLPSYKIDGVNIVVEEIPVAYKAVNERIPQLWEELKPKLVIHVGVDNCSDQVCVESQGYRMGYVHEDCNCELHPTTVVCEDSEGEDCIKTTLDLNKIIEGVSKNVDVKIAISHNVGRYLCGYIYYTSLKIDNTRTLFVHVPDLNKPYTAEELANTLMQIIIEALKCIEE